MDKMLYLLNRDRNVTEDGENGENEEKQRILFLTIVLLLKIVTKLVYSLLLSALCRQSSDNYTINFDYFLYFISLY